MTKLIATIIAIAAASSSAAFGCQFKTAEAIVCSTPFNAAMAYSYYRDHISASYTRTYLAKARCSVGYYGSSFATAKIEQLASSKIATPDGWVDIMSIAVNGSDIWYTAGAYIDGTCKKHKPSVSTTVPPGEGLPSYPNSPEP